MIWQYVSFSDLLKLMLASGLTVVLFFSLAFFFRPAAILSELSAVPEQMLLLWTFNLATLALPRALRRAALEAHLLSGGILQPTPRNDAVAALVTGDMERVEAFIRETRRAQLPRYRVVGVLTDDVRLHKSDLHGVPVMGRVADLSAILPRLSAHGVRPRKLILAKDDASKRDLEALLEQTASTEMTVARLASFGAFDENNEVRPIELADLLGRPEVVVDTAALRTMVQGKCILITGAGGSIGSELSRQIARLEPSRLIIADNGEFNLYSIDKELNETRPRLARQALLMDVRDRDFVAASIAAAKPDMVFHAAALKHVPLLEDHPVEAAKTNIIGTANVADACRQAGVPTMVTISTDKAVHPCNVMGATKRFAEAYCQALDQCHGEECETRFVTVRFGNVLGSNGSVVPLFRRQIEQGGPVTVTHPDVVRYFMTIPEAVTLVLQAGAQGIEEDDERGGICVLEMGNPIKIIDLARQMIRLSGYRPDVDIKIDIIGLRRGEKLYEEVAYGDEAVIPTRNKSVMKLAPRTADLRILQQQIQELRQACANGDSERVIRILKISVPEYATLAPDQGLQATRASS